MFCYDTDNRQHKVSRAKLSYLIDATAAPVCMIAPISSWAAAVSSVAAETDGVYSGIELFCLAIPYNFYSILTFVFIICIIVMNLDYGPMKLYELNAIVNGDVSALESPDEKDVSSEKKGIVFDLLFRWRFSSFFASSVCFTWGDSFPALRL